VLHIVSPPLPDVADLAEWVGTAVTGKVDETRRDQLRNNHTATHIVYAACRTVLGPHVWQNGAKKTTEAAHLDITHFKSLSAEDVMNIQKTANRTVQKCHQITKGFMPKDEAEKKFGFNLYQGGVVPGNELRVVDIAGTDTEACCGTHADNTAEVGTIKILKTSRISDGIVRLYYVAGERALDCIADETSIINGLCKEWGVNQPEIVTTAGRFFDGYKRLQTKVGKQDAKLLDLSIKVHLLSPEPKLLLVKTDQSNPTLFISNMPAFAEEMKARGKGVVFLGKSFLYGLLGDAAAFDTKELAALLATLGESVVAAGGKAPALMAKDALTVKGDKKAKTKPTKVTGICEFSCFAVPEQTSGQWSPELLELFVKAGFAVEAE
jgi:alanyl-tRNA synthetase